jgi:hypothetical protein
VALWVSPEIESVLAEWLLVVTLSACGSLKGTLTEPSFPPVCVADKP